MSLIEEPTAEDWQALKVGQTDSQFQEIITNHFLKLWWIVRLEGAVDGIAVIYKDPPTLHIFYLNAVGMWGNVSKVAKALMDISLRLGLKGISVTTEDPRRVRLYLQSGAKIVYQDDEVTTLELVV